MLLRNKDEQEVVTRERKDRRDFDQLAALATRMGLHRCIDFLHCMDILYRIFFLLNPNITMAYSSEI